MPPSKVVGMLKMLPKHMPLRKKTVLVVRVIGSGGGLKKSANFFDIIF
jgi:hypothetical protein